MDHMEFIPLAESNPATANRKLALVRELFAYGEAPPDNDPVLAAFGFAAAQEVADGVLGRILTETLDLRPDLSARDASNLLLRTWQKQFLRDRSLHYPNPNFEDAGYWQDMMNRMLRDGMIWGDIEIDLRFRTVQSNIPARYITHKLIMLSESERLDSQPQLLDIGTSDMQGPIKLAINHPFAGIELTKQRRSRGRFGWAVDSLSSQVINHMVAQNIDLGTSVATDVRSFRNTSNPDKATSTEAEWIRACTFRGMEFRNRQRTREFWELHKTNSPKLHFYQGAFSREGMGTFAAESPVQQFDIVSLSTVMYQMSTEEQEEARVLAREYVKPDGLIIYQDFIHIDPDDRTNFKFYPRWNAYTYRTLIEDPLDKSGELQEVFRSRDGRCRQIALGPDIGKLAMGRAFDRLGLRIFAQSDSTAP